jgi:glycosyltransferase involved in cell wall biosynthesis
MRIAIVTSGRFHVCDLARELDARGHDVRFHSLVPPWRTRRFGLPDRCNRWLGPYVAPLYALDRMAVGSRLRPLALHMLSSALDRIAARVIAPCDALIGMSALCLTSIDSVRRRFGARCLLERGNRHILSQQAIVDGPARTPGSPPRVAAWVVRRELAGYERANRIVIPSRHVEESFIEYGVPHEKLFRNPYGVDLDMFPPTPAPPADPPTILMVGTWSLRKGCDVLVEAWRRLRTPATRLLHVGPVLNVPLPDDPRFEHHDAVDQRRLTEWYARAHVLALASREEGLALVQAQALASGLHLVATDRTGAEDLRECLDDPSAVAVAAADDAGAFADALDTQLARARCQVGTRDLLGAARSRLTWAAYGERYDAMLRHW